MCGRFSLTAGRERVEKFTGGRRVPASYEPRYNLAPGQRALLLRAGADEADWARWGFPPYPTGGAARPLINARSETLAERLRFRPRLDRGRGVIPADGFYEWLKDGRARIPYRITREDGDLFALAGLWDVARTPDGADETVFTILTTRANDQIAPLHDRMPVILDAGECEAWLDPERAFRTLPADLFEPCPTSLLRMFTVSDRVNSSGYDAPDCVTPAPACRTIPLL
jgi:putative SOS response-associated peptidase YedK